MSVANDISDNILYTLFALPYSFHAGPAFLPRVFLRHIIDVQHITNTDNRQLNAITKGEIST